MRFRVFAEADETPHHLRHWKAKEKYVPPDKWWEDRKLCIEHLEKTSHSIKLNKQGVINVSGDLNLIDCGIPHIAVKFGLIDGLCKLQGNKLTDFSWGDNCIIRGNLDLGDNRFESLKGISKGVSVVAKNINLGGNPLKRGVLGLLLLDFKELAYGNSWGQRGASLTGKAEKALDIIEKHRIKHVVDHDKLIDAQHELIEAGLEEFAEV